MSGMCLYHLRVYNFEVVKICNVFENIRWEKIDKILFSKCCLVIAKRDIFFAISAEPDDNYCS